MYCSEIITHVNVLCMYNKRILKTFTIIKLCKKLFTVCVGRFLKYIPTSYHLMGHGMIERFNKRPLIIAITPESTMFNTFSHRLSILWQQGWKYHNSGPNLN